ncbi:MAG: MATE family efflux transporter [Oscillospiraceae bacterium]|nr:MATE family efflux transporter [Oscillospiraceae bacterium]
MSAKPAAADLGSGSIGHLMLQLSLPSIAAQVVNMLYNMVDRIYIGHIPNTGATALTGVGVCFPILILISAFSALIGLGGAPRASIEMGRSNREGAEKILGNCFTMLLAAAAVLTAVFLCFSRPLLMLFGASEKTLPYGLSYLNIYVLGTVFVLISVGLNAFISAQGAASTAMKTTLIGAVLNIVLDPVFIFAFGLGVRGAAIATVISQAVSAVWVLHFLFGPKTALRLRRKNLRLHRRILLPILGLGLSPFIMQSTESLLNICFNSSLQHYGGDTTVGAMSILSTLMQMVMLPLQGLALGAQPIISFNYGAQKYDRVKKAFRLLLISSFIFTAGCWALMQLLPGIFVGMFTSDAVLTKTTVWASHIYLFGLFASGIQAACQQSFLALGQAKQSLLLALLRKVILLIPLIYILPHLFTDPVFAVFLAEPVADISAACITFLTFFAWFRRNFAKPKQTPAA